MRRNVIARWSLAALPLIAGGTDTQAQSLRERVDAARGAVEFSYAAAPGVCGDGRGWYRSAGTTGGMTVFASGMATTMTPTLCEPGPVRVRMERAAGQVVAIRTWVGQDAAAEPATDLGRVSGRAAADFLLDLARGEGRIGRDAIVAATLADSAVTLDRLLTLAADRALSRETRTAALSHVAHAAAVEAGARRATDGLLALARDGQDVATIRRQALTTLARLEDGAGTAALIRLTEGPPGDWTTTESLTALASSGDPRARARLRAVVVAADADDALRAAAVRGLGQRYATAEDATLLRNTYPRLGSTARDAAIAALATLGGPDNTRWLLTMAADDSETVARRRRALDGAARAGASVPELAALYDTVGEQQLKDALVTTLGRSSERAAVDKLIDIARTETNVNVRRRAISTLASSTDPRARAVLLELIER